MLRRLAPLEDSDLGEIFERELEEGVHVEHELDLDERSSQSLLGGVVTTDGYTHVIELPDRRRPRRR